MRSPARNATSATHAPMKSGDDELIVIAVASGSPAIATNHSVSEIVPETLRVRCMRRWRVARAWPSGVPDRRARTAITLLSTTTPTRPR